MRRPSNSSSFRARVVTAWWITVACFLTWWVLTAQSSRDISLYEYDLPDRAHWITTYDETQYTACLRTDFQLPHDVKKAHFSVSAEAGFELLVNGNPVGAQVLWRPTRHFQNGLTESGQRVSAVEPITVYNFPREYQWTLHANEKVVTHFDLTRFLRKGKNTICLELEGRRTHPAVVGFGEVLLKGGARVPLQTDHKWKGEPVPKGLRQPEWVEPTASVVKWSQVRYKKKRREPLRSPVPQGVFSEYQQADWIFNKTLKGQEGQSFLTTFKVKERDSLHNTAFLNIVAHGKYWVWVNDQRLSGNRTKKKGFNGGEWLLGWEGRRPLATLPVLLDPDETADFFGGYRYKDPSHGDPTENNFKGFENTLNRTRERPNQTGGALLDDRRSAEDPKSTTFDPYGFYEEPNAAVPHTILRQQASAQHHAYDITQLLQPGENQIMVRLVDEQTSRSDVYGGSQAHKFVVTGRVGGQELNALAWVDADTGKEAFRGAALTPEETPKLTFQGGVGQQIPKLPFLLCLLLLCGTYFFGRSLHRLGRVALVYSLLLALTCLLQFSLQERSEYLFTHTALWKWGCIGSAISFTFLQIVLPKLRRGGKRVRGMSANKRPRNGYVLFILLLLLIFITRGWNAHYQPIDDDEYASIQAVLSIAETGVPAIGDGEIWYSRSPAYHYMAGAVVWLFGPNIWALRLYSALLSVLTGALLWHMAKTYFKSKWVAHASLLIFTLHPFLIFTGHIARFYQQQQLCVLLMLHLFIMGFLHQPTQRRRNGAILLFTLSVLSQEISISFVPVFILLYILFGKGVPLKWEFKSVLYLLFAGLLIVADIALFQVKCITRSVGVSPNVEATLAPTFWELGNLFSLFIGYSRLHLVLTCFYVISLIYSIRRRTSLFITLHIALIVSVFSFNLIITSVSFRYMYALIPLWILLGCHGFKVLGAWVSAYMVTSQRQIGRTYSVVAVGGLLAVLASFSVWRIPGSYKEKLLGDPNSSLTYVRHNLRPEDKVMITEPHPHAAKIELGRVDYDLVVPILYDFTYNDLSSGGVLRDRNGNAVVVNRLAQLQQIFMEEDRVWVIINREKFRSRKKNLRWEYPGAREELFLRQNCDLKFRSYLWYVYLWDKNSGKYSTFRKESNNWVE